MTHHSHSLIFGFAITHVNNYNSFHSCGCNEASSDARNEASSDAISEAMPLMNLDSSDGVNPVCEVGDPCVAIGPVSTVDVCPE